MYNSNYSSSQKRDYGNDTTYLRTSEKLRYPPQSEGLDQTPTKSPYRSGVKPSGGRVQSARRDINEVIEMVSDKKRMNEEAIGEVRMVNQEIAGTFAGGFNQFRQNIYDNRIRTAEQTRRENPRDYGVTSQFQWRPTEPENINRNQGQGGGSQESMELRARLNEQLKKNNEMLRYISSLQAQNTSLRSSYQGPSMNSLMEQNRSLRNQLANLRSNTPYNLIEELQSLKEENSKLRKETVALLKSKQSN